MFPLDTLIDEAIIINLDNQPEKYIRTYRHIKNFFSGQIHRLSASNGFQFTDKQLYSYINQSYYNNSLVTPQIDRSIIGCSISHQRTWQRCLDLGYQNILVCEDDTYFQNHTADVMGKVVKEYFSLCKEGYQDVDIIYLGCFGLCKPRHKYCWWDSIVSYGLQLRKGGTTPITVSKHLFVPEAPGGGHSYIVTRRGCLKLIALFRRDRIITHLDLQINMYRSELVLLATYPKLAFQEHRHSNLSIPSPRLLNSLFHKRYVPGEDNMPVSWLWSQRVFGLTGWSKLFIILVLLFGLPLYCIILTIYSYDLLYKDYGEFIRITIILTTTLILRHTILLFSVNQNNNKA